VIHFRPGTSDERVLKEVIERHCYRRASTAFDVERGERWLDLGANIGAFALYCVQRGATAECYEPEPSCFKLLRKNAPQFKCINAAVTASKEKQVCFNVSSDTKQHTRGTIYELNRYRNVDSVKNLWAGKFLAPPGRRFDGVKMDIEGSEGLILDRWLLPRCNKLVLEYHTSRDASVENLARRLREIRKRFKQVAYPPEYDRAIAGGATQFNSFFDRLIFAWEPR
jgi:FkbM family methyltransferase